MGHRQERVNHLLRDELAFLLQRQVRDPRLSGIISIIQVKTSPDMRDAQVFVSIMASEKEKQEAMDALVSASGFFRHELSLKLSWRRVPQLHFLRDDSLERAADLMELMKRALPSQD